MPDDEQDGADSAAGKIYWCPDCDVKGYTPHGEKLLCWCCEQPGIKSQAGLSLDQSIYRDHVGPVIP